MTRSAFLGLLVAATFAMAAPAQVGHPAKGSWSGYWGTSDASKKRILLLLDWRNQKITGLSVPVDGVAVINVVDLLALDQALENARHNRCSEGADD